MNHDIVYSGMYAGVHTIPNNIIVVYDFFHKIAMSSSYDRMQDE